MKLQQQQQQQQQQSHHINSAPSLNVRGTPKSSSGNMMNLQSNHPIGTSIGQSYTRSDVDMVTNTNDTWSNASNEFQYSNDNQSLLSEDQSKSNDEELTSMLQRYLDSHYSLDFACQNQKSPGQLSSDSGFSGDTQNPVKSGFLPETPSSNHDGFELHDYEDTGEDLSQLVDQVLSSIDAQFPQDPYLQYVDQSTHVR